MSHISIRPVSHISCFTYQLLRLHYMRGHALMMTFAQLYSPKLFCNTHDAVLLITEVAQSTHNSAHAHRDKQRERERGRETIIQRERERKRQTYTHRHTHTHTHNIHTSSPRFLSLSFSLSLSLSFFTGVLFVAQSLQILFRTPFITWI